MAMKVTAHEAPDGELVRRARDGDRDAFTVLIDRYRRLAVGLAYARLQDREEAEDVAQDAFVRAYRALDRFDPDASWPAWFGRIVTNLCFDALRKRRVRLSAPPAPEPPHEPGPERRFLDDERMAAVRRAVAQLPAEHRAPIVLRYAMGLPRKDVAAALGVRESTVTGRLAGGLRTLRRKLAGEMP
jgi:RNA polymerase sigma-70 factor (ECF subfamily)